MSIALDRQIARWYELIPHPVQISLMGAVARGVRFPVVPAGRRSGKSERAKRFLAREASNEANAGGLYFAGAPTFGQSKKIFWDDLKKLTLTAAHEKRPSESDSIIYMPSGAEVHIIGFDRPERFEGVPWTGGVIDEIANIKEGSWESHILPALNTVNPTNPEYRAWCWLIGVPEGLNHYYDMADYAENSGDPDWELFHWISSDILPVDVIEAAKRQMSPQQYRQEYEAGFETASGRIYSDYSKANYTDERILAHEQLLWYHDFNYTPMSNGIGVRRGNDVYLLDEIILNSAVARQSALEFVERYRNHDNKNVIIYGDPAGRQGEKHGHASDYTEMEVVLKSAGWKYQRRVRPAAPAIKDRQNAVRAKVMNAAGEVSLYVNIKKAPYTHKGLATVQLKKNSTFLEEESDYQHITTAIGYMVYHEWPVNGRGAKLLKVTGI